MESQNVRSSSAPIAAPAEARRRGDDLRRGVNHLIYLVTGLPVAVGSFALLLCGISLSAGLAVVWVGIPLALATLELARQLARLERSRLRSVGVYVPARTSVGNSLRSRCRSWWRPVGVDGRAWRELAHGLVVLPLAVATFSMTVTWTVGAIGGLTSWLWSGWLPATSVTLSEFIGLPRAAMWPDVLLGLVFALTTLPVLRMCVLVHARVARVLLGGPGTPEELS